MTKFVDEYRDAVDEESEKLTAEIWCRSAGRSAYARSTRREFPGYVGVVAAGQAGGDDAIGAAGPGWR
jgi:hypothetical protein